MAKSKHKHRRQLPENFEVGDHVLLPLLAEGCLVRNEPNEDGEWLFTLQLTRIQSERIEYSAPDTSQAPVRKMTPVLWSVRGDGEIEIVIELSARQRLQVLGMSARQKEALRSNLASLPAAEAANLLKKLVESELEPVRPTGHLANGNFEKKPIRP